MAAVIGTYNYTYGAGAQSNRQIQFSRTGLAANTIQAQVFVLNQDGGVGVRTSIVSGDKINVEGESTTSKVNAMVVERALRNARAVEKNSNPDRLLTNLSTAEQDGIMQAFPGWKVQVTYNPGVAEGDEVIESLSIYDPR